MFTNFCVVMSCVINYLFLAVTAEKASGHQGSDPLNWSYFTQIFTSNTLGRYSSMYLVKYTTIVKGGDIYHVYSFAR